MTCEVVLEDCIRVGARVPYTIDLTLVCASLWAGGKVVPSTSRIRPTRRPGFEFEAQNAGQTGGREPRWPVVLGATVQDGGVSWIAREISNGSLQKTLVSVDWQAPAQVTVSGENLTTAGGAQLARAYLAPSAAGIYTVVAWAHFSDAPQHREGFAIQLEVI